MGTSSGYKGSKSNSWKIVRELFSELSEEQEATSETNPTTDGQTSEPTQTNDSAEQLITALAQALAQENTVGSGHRHNYSVGGLLGGVGGGTAGGGAKKSRASGGGARHQAVRNAARASVAIGAAYDLRNGNDQRLGEIGLNLNELRTLSPRQQCAKIAEVVFGDTRTPDEAALKRATIEHIKEVLLAEQPLTIEDTIRSFIADHIFQLGLIELKALNNEQQIPVSQLPAKEEQLKKWLRIKAADLPVGRLDSLSVQRLANATAKLMEAALRIFGPQDS